MNRSAIQGKLREETVKAISISHQSDALRKLYEAAVMVGNNALADGYREQIHQLLDLQLDTTSSICALTRALIESDAD